MELVALYKRVIGLDMHQAQITACALIEEPDGTTRIERPDFSEPHTLAHGRIESRSIWTTTRLNDPLDFPGVGQAFVIERHTVDKITGKHSSETVYGITSHTPKAADAAPRALLQSRPLVHREQLPLHPRLELG